MFKSIALLTPIILFASLGHAAPTPNTEMKKVLTELDKKNPLPIEKLTALEARKQPTPTDAVKALMIKEKKSTKPEKVAKVEEKEISGGVASIPARFYYPEGLKKPFATIVYYHGGGFVIADNNVYDATPRALANQTKSLVISVEYRKAPENKFPAAHEDAFAAYKWVVNHIQTYGGDPKKIAVAGESAGANLAINTAIRARDARIVLPAHILAVYPLASSDMNSVSYQENADAKPLNKPMMGWFVEQYLNKGSEAQDPRINLVNANLAGLPSTTIITAEIDPLKMDGENLASKMKAAGVDVEYKTYNGVTHEFFGMAPVLKEARDAQAFASQELKASLQQ